MRFDNINRESVEQLDEYKRVNIPSNTIAIHLVNQVNRNLKLVDPKTYTFSSGVWAIDYAAARALIGKNIYLHPTKGKASINGGEILDVKEGSRIDKEFEKGKSDPKTEDGVVFIFRMTREAKAGVKWPTGKSIISQEIMAFDEGIDEAAYEKDMDHDKVVVVRGVKGVKSTPFRKKFKNMAAYDRWSDSEEASDYEVHDVMNEADDTRMGTITVTSDEERKRRAQAYRDKKAKEVKEALTLDYSRYMRSHGKKPRVTGPGLFMFTTTDMGEPAEDDVFQFQGKWPDAKRAAAKWARGKGAYRFYMMEHTITEDDCQCANGETTQEQLLDMLENAMISIEQDLESGKLMDAHALQLGENYLVYEALYNKISSGADLGESANQKLDEVDWGTAANVALTAAPLLIPGVGVGALAGLAGRAALGALAKRGGMALAKRGLQKVAPNLMKRLGQTKIGRGATQVGGQAAMGALNPAADGPVVDRPDSDTSAGQDLLGLAAQSGLSSTDLELVKRAAASRK